MILKETKRKLKNLYNKYSELLQRAKRDLAWYGVAEPCEYTGIEENDRDAIFKAISTLYYSIIEDTGPILFDIRNVYITEKRALNALGKLNEQVKRDRDQLLVIKAKYAGRKEVDNYAIEHCLRYHQDIYDILTEILNSSEVKTFLTEPDDPIHRGIQPLSGKDPLSKNKDSVTNEKLTLHKKYSGKEAKLFEQLQKRGFIIGGNKEDFAGLFGGYSTNKIQWRKDGNPNEAIFLIVLLYIFAFDDYTKFNNNNIDKRLINEIITNKIDFSRIKTPTMGTITNWRSLFKSYIIGKPINIGKGAKTIPLKNNDLIDIVKKTFAPKFAIPFEVKN